ncbi:class I adenylate-forming enzyme family protein [Haliea sp. E17]|uniref:class I adenylate-forming enzyme family protein n=1 Tax=Haliea sp. E17 TaxID=3401576 RepID=UPI003AAF033C
MPALLHSIAAAYGDETAMVYQDDAGRETSISFAGLEQRSAELARGLVARGVGKGTRVGFIYGNSPTFAVLFAAITRVGAIAIPISTLIKSNELVRVLRQSDVAGLVVQRNLLGKDYVGRMVDALPDLANAPGPELRLEDVPYLRWIVSDGEALPSSVRSWDWLEGGAQDISEGLLAVIEAEVYPTDQVMEIYTSGSMAMPKGVRHNQGPLLSRARYIHSMQPLKRGDEQAVLMPMFWIGGLIMYFMPNLLAGVRTRCADRTLSDSRFAMGSVPAKGEVMAPPEGWPVWALGMTETIGPYSYGDELRVPGYPLCPPLDHFAEGFEVRVADQQGNPMPEGERGEIQVRGYALTPGLHKLEREGYFTADGFYHTGDMGIRQGERILFVGRDGDMIKTASANVSPAEVEMELQDLEGVHTAYVLGIPDEERGQLVVAAVVPRDGAVLEAEALQAELRDRLSSFKVPRAIVFISREEIPMLHSNKVARRQLAQMLAERLGRAA